MGQDKLLEEYKNFIYQQQIAQSERGIYKIPSFEEWKFHKMLKDAGKTPFEK